MKDEVDANTIKSLQLNEVLEAYDKFVLPEGTSRRKLSVHLVAQNVENAVPANCTVVRDKDEAVFKAGLTCSAAAIPIKRVQ